MTESTGGKRRASRRSASTKKTTAAPTPSAEEQAKVDKAQQEDTTSTETPPADPAPVEGSTDVNLADNGTESNQDSDNAASESSDDKQESDSSEDEATPAFTMPDDIGPVAEGVISTVKTYSEKMAKGVPITSAVGTQQQVLIYRAFQRMLSLDGKELYTTINAVLSIINQERASAFHEKRVYRFVDQVKLSTHDRKCFERLMNMFIMVCNPATRKQAVKQIDVELTASTLRDSEKEQKLIAFFSN